MPGGPNTIAVPGVLLAGLLRLQALTTGFSLMAAQSRRAIAFPQRLVAPQGLTLPGHCGAG